jgi:hypothetical protein
MSARSWSAGAVLTAGLVLLAPGTAGAAPVTPAGSGGGCKANGQEVASNAQEFRPFGRNVVQNFAPIAPLNAAFFTAFCS